MTQINFQPIFDYIDQNNQVLKEEIMVEVRAELRGINTRIDNLTGQVKKFNDEMLISGHRLDRLEHWAKPVGDKLNIPIEL